MAALEVIGPSEKISEFKIKDVVKVLKNTAAKISEL